MSKQGNHKLSFGIMTNGPILKQWQITAIEKLISIGMRFSLVIENHDDDKSQPSKIKKYLGKNCLYNFYLKYIFKADNLTNINAANLLAQASHISIKPIHKGKYSTYFKEEDIESIKAKNLDFILRFGFNIIRGEVLNTAKYGVWSFHHDDEQIIRGGPPGFWEIIENHSINGIMLQRLTDELDGGFQIRKGMFPIIKHSYSTHVNELMNHGIDLLIFAASNLQEYGEIQFTKVNNANTKIYRFPGNRTMIKFFFKQVFQRIKFNFKDLFLHENWNIGVIKQNIEELVINQNLDEINFAPETSNSSFAADVFIQSCDSEIKIFYEHFDYKIFKGNIASRTFDLNTLKFSNSKVFIKEKYHQAFPFIWEYEKINYIIPESSFSGKLAAYKLNDSHEITEKKVILNKECVDAVLFEHSGLFWIFCTHKTYGTNQNLFAYYSHNPWTGWEPHQQNPIVSDAGNARMAGNIIPFEGKLFRPSQKNNNYYGEAIVLNKILELSTTKYRESKVFIISPKKTTPYKIGIHTLSWSGDYIAIDAKNHKFVYSEFIRKLKLKFNR